MLMSLLAWCIVAFFAWYQANNRWFCIRLMRSCDFLYHRNILSWPLPVPGKQAGVINTLALVLSKLTLQVKCLTPCQEGCCPRMSSRCSQYWRLYSAKPCVASCSEHVVCETVAFSKETRSQTLRIRQRCIAMRTHRLASIRCVKVAMIQEICPRPVSTMLSENPAAKDTQVQNRCRNWRGSSLRTICLPLMSFEVSVQTLAAGPAYHNKSSIDCWTFPRCDAKPTDKWLAG